VSRKRDTRYPHAFSKGRAVWFHPLGDSRRRKAVMTAYPVKLDPARWKYIKASPTLANVHQGSLGLIIVCADCLNARGFRNPGLPDRFGHHWHLTLLEIEKLCRCQLCGSRNARVGPWWGEDGGGPLGLEGPPRGLPSSPSS
jgi:hypothetical protein